MVRGLEKIRNFQFKGILLILGCFLLIGAVLFAERSGISCQESTRQSSYIEKNQVITEKAAVKELAKTCLVLTDSSQPDSVLAWEQFEQIFMDMKVGTDVVDIEEDELPALDGYQTVVVLISDLNPLKEKVLEISNWVKEGGRALFALTLQKDSYVTLIQQKLGVISSGYSNTMVDSIYFDEDFLLGGCGSGSLCNYSHG